MKHAGGLFPRDMSQAQAAILARLSLAYGLDPFAEEIILYQGKPYTTIKGLNRVAANDERFDGMEDPVPATPEQREAFLCMPGEAFWIVRVWRKDRRLPAVGYGRAGGKTERNDCVDNQRALRG